MPDFGTVDVSGESPQDPRPGDGLRLPIEGATGDRIRRGGSFDNYAATARSASFGRGSDSMRISSLGFPAARALE